MGISTTKDIVPFAMHNVLFIAHNENITDNKLLFITNETIVNKTFNGWSIVSNPQDDYNIFNIGKNNNIYTYKYQKDNNYVFIINESEYSSAAEYDICIASDDEESIKLFVNDFDLSVSDIEKDSIVSCTY